MTTAAQPGPSLGPGRSAGLRIWLVVAIALGACSSSADGDGTGESSTTISQEAPAATEVEPLAVTSPESPAAGSARVVLGRSVDAVLEIERCLIDDAAAPDGAKPAAQVEVRATGTLGDGSPLIIELVRFVSPGAAVTITDTVTVVVGPEDAPTAVLQAQRFEVEGLVTDGREPEARTPLVRIVGATIEARGRFAPPGSFADDGGLVEGVVLATCPA